MKIDYRGIVVKNMESATWEDLAIVGVPNVPNVLGVSTKDNEIGLNKYIESGDKREKGRTNGTNGTVETWEEAMGRKKETIMKVGARFKALSVHIQLRVF